MAEIRTRKNQIGFRKSHAFVIGINEYPYMSTSLNTATNDAIQIATRLKAKQGFDNVLLMLDVDKQQIESLFAWLKKENRESPFSIPNKDFPDPATPATLLNSFDNQPYSSKIGWIKFESELEAGLTDAEKMNLPQFIIDSNQEKEDEKEPTRLILVDALPDEDSNENITKDADAIDFPSLYLVASSAIDISRENTIEEGDSVVFYYAGHGIPKKAAIVNGPEGYLAPTDAQNKRTIDDSLIPMIKVSDTFTELGCKHTLLILDCCFAGRFRLAQLTRSSDIDAFLPPMYERRFLRFINGKAMQVLVSSGPEQVALDAAEWAGIRKNSPFANTLIIALEGGNADISISGNRGRNQGDGILTVSELYMYVWDKVEEISSQGLSETQYPGLFPLREHGVGEFIFFNPNLGITQKFPADPDINPYKGLKAYEATEEDAHLFFGRDKAIKEVKGKFEQLVPKNLPPILFITASSGTGKSSLVKAGVFPKLPTAKKFFSLRPNELLTAATENKLVQLETALEEEDSYLILIDQYEEIFEFSQATSLQAKLFNLLEKKDEEGHRLLNKHHLIITIRSDFEWKVRKSPLNKYWKEDHIYRLAPMDLKELRSALTGPAWWAMYDFQDKSEASGIDQGEALIGKILEEVANSPGALPLLSFTMYAFYEHAKNNFTGQKLRLADYTTILKGVQGALSTIADGVYNEDLSRKANAPIAEEQEEGSEQKEEGTEQEEEEKLPKVSPFMESKTEQQIMKKLMLRMIETTGGAFTRRRIYYAENLSNGESLSGLDQFNQTILSELDFPENQVLVKLVIDKLEAAHLIIQDRDENDIPFIELAHDSLITHWDTCQEWIAELGKENLILRGQLWQAVLDREKGIFEKKNLKNLNDIKATPQSSLNEASEDILTSSSLVWDNSPKLLQVLNEIDFSVLKDIMEESGLGDVSEEVLPFILKKFQSQNDAFFVKLFAPLSEALIKELFSRSTHWLNQAEIQFIVDSWHRKESRFSKLKGERDAALRMVRANSNVITAIQLDKTNPTLALRMAEKNYLLYPESSAAAGVFLKLIMILKNLKQ